MIEAAVVIYIRQILYAGGFQLLHIPMNDMVLRVELIREVASLILLWAAAELSAKTPQTKFYVFIALFGLWDYFLLCVSQNPNKLAGGSARVGYLISDSMDMDWSSIGADTRIAGNDCSWNYGTLLK